MREGCLFGTKDEKVCDLLEINCAELEYDEDAIYCISTRENKEKPWLIPRLNNNGYSCTRQFKNNRLIRRKCKSEGRVPIYIMDRYYWSYRKTPDSVFNNW